MDEITANSGINGIMEQTTRPAMVSVAVMVSILLVALDTTVVTTAMPHIVQ